MAAAHAAYARGGLPCRTLKAPLMCHIGLGDRSQRLARPPGASRPSNTGAGAQTGAMFTDYFGLIRTRDGVIALWRSVLKKRGAVRIEFALREDALYIMPPRTTISSVPFSGYMAGTPRPRSTEMRGRAFLQSTLRAICTECKSDGSGIGHEGRYHHVKLWQVSPYG
ncbi:hypothetical protein BV20DRAFT_519250 [Pilatotrama ljubarskyi]|nr:hypothetical protein BV20DRAFT_519250 [Pilatotrama ljubarskyi]